MNGPITPTYYVRHPDGTHSIAQPQPTAEQIAAQATFVYAQCDRKHGGPCCEDPGCYLATPAAAVPSIDMLLYCPNCGVQHIDAPDRAPWFATSDDVWTNPPHRSHLCHGCGCIWRPADVPTNGVAEIKTQGKADTWPAPHNEEVRAAAAAPTGSQP